MTPEQVALYACPILLSLVVYFVRDAASRLRDVERAVVAQGPPFAVLQEHSRAHGEAVKGAGAKLTDHAGQLAAHAARLASVEEEQTEMALRFADLAPARSRR